MFLACAILFLLSSHSGYAQKTVLFNWETWWWEATAEPAAPLNLKDKALNDLKSGVAGDQKDGDLIQLGYFGDATTLAPTATKNNPFKGTFLNLTGVTTIGDSLNNSGYPDGEFYFETDFTENDDTAKHYTGASGAYTEEVTGLANKLTALETAVANFSNPGDDDAGGYLAIRFFDSDTQANGGGAGALGNTDLTTMYNTVTDVSGTGGGSNRWLWVAMNDSGSQVNHVALYDDDADPNNALRTDLLWEFDNSVYDGDATVDANTILPSPTALTLEPGATTITYIAPDANLGTGAFSNDGDFVVSNLDLTTGTPSIDTGDKTGLSMIINTADGHTAEVSAGALGGDDLGLIKVGAGTQQLRIATTTGGAIKVRQGTLVLGKNSGGTIFTDDTVRDINSYIDISRMGASDTATLHINPTTDGSTPGTAGTEWARFITGTDATAALTFSDLNGHELQLGLDGTEDLNGDSTTEKFQTFAGTVNVPGTASNKATINVTELNGWQKVGAIAGNGDLEKKGSGILEVTGASGSFGGNVILDGGTLGVGHANALGGQGIGSNNFKKGKLSVASGVTFADAVNTTGASGKTMIGGAGTYNNAIVLDDAAGAHTFHELDPGMAASVSLSNQNSGYQVVQNPENTIGSFTAAGLTWNAGGIFNWEIKDFDDSDQNQAGTNWDLFNFTGGTALDLSVTGRKIRILGITPTAYSGGAVDPRHGTADGEMGIPENWDFTAREFKFMTGTFSNTDPLGNGGYFDSTYFDIDTSQFSWLTRDWNGVWKVRHNSGALYLTYMAVPEPSTYVMVVGALFLPVWNFFRRRRSRRKEEE
ncbi:MAG: hypothetical protein CMI31_11450 [Opitutae bacterium]|nr:hypothetical protein [Opitutae bacterium]|tara:strand:+ start:629 stop:3091 length:2463 start_codon:yes stop_codon:yes gene_type:complete